MCYHNLIAIIIDKWHIKLRSSSFIWCNSYDAYFPHEWLKAIWREETKKSFGGRYLNFKEKITFLENGVKSFFNSAFCYGRQPVKTNSFDKIMEMQALLKQTELCHSLLIFPDWVSYERGETQLSRNVILSLKFRYRPPNDILVSSLQIDFNYLCVKYASLWVASMKE